MKKILTLIVCSILPVYAIPDMNEVYRNAINRNNNIPTRQYTVQEKNLQWATDICLRDVVSCTNTAYSIAKSGEYGQKLFNGKVDIVGEQTLYNNIFYFYAVKYRERWERGYYIPANPVLWNFGIPN